MIVYILRTLSNVPVPDRREVSENKLDNEQENGNPINRKDIC